MTSKPYLFLTVLLSGLFGCDNSQSQNAPDFADHTGVNSAVEQQSGESEGESSDEPADGDNSKLLQNSSLNPEATAAWPEARYASAGKILAVPQRAGDPVEGRRALLEEDYVSCGFPERVFRKLMDDAPVISVAGRTELADGLPYSVNIVENQDGIKIVTNNCLTCHATPLFGELVIGLGNEFLDFTGNASVRSEQAGALVEGGAETRAWEQFADRIAAIAPHIRTETIGVNPANNLTFALVAHRDAKTGAWSDEPLLPLPPTKVPPVSVPAWWRMAKKPAMFNMGEGRADHARMMMAASLLCTDSLSELEAIDQYAPHIRAYISSLQPPAYPFEIDLDAAENGEAVFVQNCSRCHGTYPQQGNHSYPARLVPIETVGTDPTLVDFMHGEGAAYLDWFNRSFFGKLSLTAPGPGYVAPPLDGIWATAPFLHNGSVPTISMVLDSASRPRYWRHTISDASDPASYDQIRLGWAHEVLAPEQAQSADKAIYDTRLPGYSNEGHIFGDHLDDQQRSAVIEYLKTL